MQIRLTYDFGCKMKQLSPNDLRIVEIRFRVDVQNLSTKKVENSPSFSKKDEPLSQPKSERFG